MKHERDYDIAPVPAGQAHDEEDMTYPPVDCRTVDEKIAAHFADLDTAVSLLTTEVEHLREDVARMKTGASEL